ncbi:hypothetical protein SRB5_24120 [Streptomyces sp. RB5]|uniref:Asp23/Gls24 family envelope stress response protein n=1 Tax=Streptomyces smaragdinus TaxID=2585196 RepID=A0A7K0CFM9_9ACTN|nr:hypothetical protein [Streptomyces smaragdinus]MQY12279.1 hypothetical protein [Streptomyces smaragdinus]
MTSPETVPPHERGSTRIADRVIAKIASQAAREALRGAPGTDSRHAAVVRRGSGARIRVGVELGFPSDIRAQCVLVRGAVAERVIELAGLTTAEVAVEVERLHTAGGGRPRHGRVR